MAEGMAEQDQIEQDLARTRARIDGRLSELQARLTPGQVLDDLMGYIRGSEGGDFARNLMTSVRSNPLPAALTGIGLTWLMAANSRPQSGSAASGAIASTLPRSGGLPASPGPLTANQDDLELRVRTAEQTVTRAAGDTDDSYRGRLDDARGGVLGIARSAQDTAASFSQRVQDALASAKQNITQSAQDARDKVSDTASQFSRTAQDAGDQLSQSTHAARQMGSNLIATIADNPVLLGAIGLGLGALLGALVPQSEQEEAALGGIAGRARDTAKNLAQDVVDRGSQVAQQVLDVGRESASAQGLTGDKSIGDVVEGIKSGTLAENVKQVAKDVLQAGDQAVRNDGSGQDQMSPVGTSAAANPAASSPGRTGTPPPRAG